MGGGGCQNLSKIAWRHLWKTPKKNFFNILIIVYEVLTLYNRKPKIMLSKWVVLNSIFAFGTCIENQSVFWIVPPPPLPRENFALPWKKV